MRLLYSLLLYLAAPIIFLRLWWRGIGLPAYRQRWGERCGWVSAPAGTIAVWVHAVSVGEAMAALPLVEALLERYGEGSVWMTTTTPTGSARVQAALGSRVHHSYAPYDWPRAVARFLAAVHPARVVVMETELWPNLYAQLAQRRIPVLVANARLSPRSFKGYQRVRGLVGETLASCQLIAAQSAADAERFRILGATHVEALGNLKFDLSVPPEAPTTGLALRRRFGEGRPVWLAASTHEGEEEAALEAHRSVLAVRSDAVLILVPRHPQRFPAVARLCAQRGLRIARRSSDAIPADCQLLLGDTMGEMFTYACAADAAFVGGSLVPVGGHNVLEPAAIGLPVLFGPHMFNFVGARDLLLEAGAARQIGSVPELAAAVCALLADPEQRRRMGAAGQAAVSANRGVLQRLLERITALGSA